MPSAALPMLKLLNPWIIRTPEGTSCLFTPLLNRSEVQIIPFGAIVETDRFFAPIHLPFLLVPPPGGRVRIERGTPVAQIIPFRRENWASVRGQGDGAARAATAAIMTAESEGAYARRIRMRGQFR